MTSPASSLRRLLAVISAAIDDVEAQYTSANVTTPSLDAPFDPSSPAEERSTEPDVARSLSLIVSAAAQLAAACKVPAIAIMEHALAYHLPSVLQTVLVGNVAELLREAGPEGLSSSHMSKKNGIDSDKLSRCLRLLATHHIFREIQPDVWTHNRLSSMLDTGKSSTELFSQDRALKYQGTGGLAAFVEHATDEFFRVSIVLPEHLTASVPTTTAYPTAFNRAFDTPLDLFSWYALPAHSLRRARFDVAMTGLSRLDHGDSILRGFPWESLGEGAKVVDVGAGAGSLSLAVAKAHPSLRLVVQDLPNVIEGSAKQFWGDRMPESLSSGQVVLQGHDFFAPQSAQNTDASLFVLRMVLHDWPASKATAILRHLRAASTPHRTKLLVVENMPRYACRGSTAGTGEDGEDQGAAVPEPLLGNGGYAAAMAYLMDLQMMLIDGHERTIGDFRRITADSGWKIVRVYSPSGSNFKHILAEAI